MRHTTYFTDDVGKIACCGLDYADSHWFDDGYGDHIRHYLWAMGAIPEFAPLGQNHLLRSSSVVKKVNYQNQAISYETFDSDATEVLRLNSAPAQIKAGTNELHLVDILKQDGYTVRNLPAGGVAVHLQHKGAREVNVSW